MSDDNFSGEYFAEDCDFGKPDGVSKIRYTYEDSPIRPIFTAPSDDTDHRWLMPEQREIDPAVKDLLYDMLAGNEVQIVPGLWQDRLMEISLVPHPGPLPPDLNIKPVYVDFDDEDK